MAIVRFKVYKQELPGAEPMVSTRNTVVNALSSCREQNEQNGQRGTLSSRVMRILDRYIVREVSRHAFLGLVVFTFVFLVPRLVQLMEIYVRHVGSDVQIFKFFLCIFPGVFVFTVPIATLIGVLLGLGRMSADSEVIALTALGIGRRRILLPVGTLALAGALLTLTMTGWVGPAALRTLHAAEAELARSQISFQ